MKSAANKRSIVLDGRKTSISLEDSLWTELKDIAHFKRVSVARLIAAIDATRKQSNLSSEIRIFMLEHFRKKRKKVDLPHADRATSSDEGRSTQAWRTYARRT